MSFSPVGPLRFQDNFIIGIYTRQIPNGGTSNNPLVLYILTKATKLTSSSYIFEISTTESNGKISVNSSVAGNTINFTIGSVVGNDGTTIIKETDSQFYLGGVEFRENTFATRVTTLDVTKAVNNKFQEWYGALLSGVEYKLSDSDGSEYNYTLNMGPGNGLFDGPFPVLLIPTNYYDTSSCTKRSSICSAIQTSYYFLTGNDSCANDAWVFKSDCADQILYDYCLSGINCGGTCKSPCIGESSGFTSCQYNKNAQLFQCSIGPNPDDGDGDDGSNKFLLLFVVVVFTGVFIYFLAKVFIAGNEISKL